MLESLLEWVHADLLPSLERLGGVALAHTLDAQVLEDVGHVGLGDLHGADALLAQAWNGGRLEGKLVTGYRETCQTDMKKDYCFSIVFPSIHYGEALAWMLEMKVKVKLVTDCK